MSRLEIEIGDDVETTDGKSGTALEVHQNWILVALAKGGQEAINRADICSAERRRNDIEGMRV